MLFMANKRPSTVARLSRKALVDMIAFCRENNCGIILRQKGEEIGYTADQLQEFLKHADSWSVSLRREVFARFNVRKGWLF